MSCCDTNYFYPQVLVGQEAPDFTAAAVLGTGEIVDNFNFKRHKKWFEWKIKTILLTLDSNK